MFIKIYSLALLFLFFISGTGISSGKIKPGTPENKAIAYKDSSSKKTQKILSAKEIWNNYINAIGGAESIRSVNDRTTIMQSNISGQSMAITTYQKAPNRMRQVITTSSISQEIYFDGIKGSMEISGKKNEITGKELDRLKYNSILNLVLNIDSLGIKLRSAGTEKVNGKISYKIEMIMPSGVKIIQYFDAKTWLKVKQVESLTAAKKDYTQETYFDDYREVKGVKYPYSIKENLGAQKLDLTVLSLKINSGLDDSLFIIK